MSAMLLHYYLQSPQQRREQWNRAAEQRRDCTQSDKKHIFKWKQNAWKQPPFTSLWCPVARVLSHTTHLSRAPRGRLLLEPLWICVLTRVSVNLQQAKVNISLSLSSVSPSSLRLIGAVNPDSTAEPSPPLLSAKKCSRLRYRQCCEWLLPAT